MPIYKILTADEWAAFQASGRFDGAPIDLTDGYIHASTATQVQETAEKHFAGQDGLVVAAFDPDVYGDDLKWEVSRGGAKFPHIYDRPLRIEEVLWWKPIPTENGVPRVPLS